MIMPIPFTQIPEVLLVPGQYQEVDNSLAGSTGDIKKALIIACKSAAGTAPAGTPVRVLADLKAASLFGYGSPAAILAKTFLSLNKIEECWVLPVDAPGAATPWQVTYTVAVTAAQKGAAAIAVNGQKIDAAAIAAGDTAEAVAAAIAARINSELWLPVEAETGTGGEFTVKSVVAGTGGNHNTVVINSEAAGVAINAGAITPGTQAANIKPLFEGLGSVRYNYFISDFSDAENIAALGAELDSRFGAMRQIGGRAFVALSGGIGSVSEPGTVLAQAEAVNNPHVVLVPRLTSPQLPGEWAARWCAIACRVLADDPAANTYDLAVTGLASSVEADADTRQILLAAGIATCRLDTTGNVLIERLVTSYTENTDGGRDTSYLDIQVTETVDAVRTYVNAEAKKRYKAWKLASTEENFGSGAKVMTAGIFRSFLCELYQAVFIQQKRWCQDFDGYKNSLIVEVKKGSKTWLEYSHQPNLIGQFYIGAGLMQFK
ncbi:MAG: phage tail sheath protein [Treponema sp.]|jgi:phage tail sheath gpL-like|nr:phage tail sheath protein [Treponema sp.]